jgi:hypothetical protein
MQPSAAHKRIFTHPSPINGHSNPFPFDLYKKTTGHTSCKVSQLGTNLGGISDEFEQMRPRFKHQNSDGATQLIPKFLAGTEFSTTFLPKRVGQFEYLMNKKRQEYEKKKIVRRILLAVSEIVFRVVSLILQGVEIFIFDLPSGAAGSDKFRDIVRVDRNVGHPTAEIHPFFTLGDRALSR